MPFEPTTPPPPMTLERAREVLTRWTEHTENLIEARTPGLDPPAPRNLVERGAALRHALARLAVLDAVAAALGPVIPQITRGMGVFAGTAPGGGSQLGVMLTQDECRAILAADALLRGG